MQSQAEKPSFLSLTPFLVFVGLFLTSALFFSSKISPLFSCLIALIYSLFTFREKIPFNKKVEVFLAGGAQPTVIAMIYIFIFSAIFTYILKLIGGTEAAVKVGMQLLPQNYILPGFFTIVSIFATAIGSSMGAIAAFLPIGMGIAQKIGTDPALMAGVVVSGAMLGDNLSIISDTTIAATQTTGARMADKFKANIKLVIPAFLLTVGILMAVGGTPSTDLIASATLTYHDAITIIPYAVVFLFALLGIDVIAVLVLGILTAIGIGIAQGTFTFVRGTSLILEGFAKDAGGIQEVLILALLISGLTYIVEYNGGITYILQLFSTRITSKGTAELYIALLTFLVSAAVAINTIAILVTGPVAKKIGDSFGLKGKRVASLLDVVACICQGILPYAPQLLLAGSLAGVSSIAIMPHLHYQWAILLVTVVSIARTWLEQK